MMNNILSQNNYLRLYFVFSSFRLFVFPETRNADAHAHAHALPTTNTCLSSSPHFEFAQHE